jgi:hypothetical protein
VAYATVTDLFVQLNLPTPTSDQTETGQACLDAAAAEIDSYLSWTPPPPDEAPAMVVLVNRERAAEHWRFSPYGLLSQAPDIGPVFSLRDSWYRHSRKLAYLKVSWGVG